MVNLFRDLLQSPCNDICDTKYIACTCIYMCLGSGIKENDLYLSNLSRSVGDLFLPPSFLSLGFVNFLFVGYSSGVVT